MGCCPGPRLEHILKEEGQGGIWASVRGVHWERGPEGRMMVYVDTKPPPPLPHPFLPSLPSLLFLSLLLPSFFPFLPPPPLPSPAPSLPFPPFPSLCPPPSLPPFPLPFYLIPLCPFPHAPPSFFPSFPTWQAAPAPTTPCSPGPGSACIRRCSQGGLGSLQQETSATTTIGAQLSWGGWQSGGDHGPSPGHLHQAGSVTALLLGATKPVARNQAGIASGVF